MTGTKKKVVDDLLRQVLDRVDQLHDLDLRSSDEIIGYDELGVPY